MVQLSTAINILYANLIIKHGREKADALIARLHAEMKLKGDYCPSFLKKEAARPALDDSTDLNPITELDSNGA